MKTFKYAFHIPIYKALAYVVIADDALAARRKMNHILGKLPNTCTGWSALHSCSGKGAFGVFFYRKWICVEEVAHETFHMTHRILQWQGARFSVGNQESAALLHGYLMSRVMGAVKRFVKK